MATILGLLSLLGPVRAQLPPLGKDLYQTHCAACHHSERIGLSGPPLLPLTLGRATDDKLKGIISKGLPATRMPAFSQLNAAEIQALVAYLRTPSQSTWTEEEIRNSLHVNVPTSPSPPRASDRVNLTAVVERGRSLVWVMEGQRILDRFAFENVHGGLKFSPDGESFYVPSRDGWIGRYVLGQGLVGRVRSSIFLRNLALSHDGQRLLAASWLPSALVVLESESLEPLKVIPVEGKISAIYELDSRQEAIFTFRDRPALGILDTHSLEVRYQTLEEPLEDFFVDPLERYLVGTSRKGTRLVALDLTTLQRVFEHSIEGLPHLASAAFWYDRGKFFFASTHIEAPYLTVWQMYDWALTRKIPLAGNGFFVRTHPQTPYLWIDQGNSELALVSRRDLQIQSKPMGQKVAHTEFSGDGSLAYVSLSEPQGALVMLDAATLSEVGRHPASFPMGKYNFLTKQKRYDGVFLGQQVFMERCWGCHHPTQEAFGPSLQEIFRRRTPAEIMAQILDPEGMHGQLGYQRNAMTRQNLTPEELQALLAFMKEKAHAANQ
ncbi:c-type cytochrome [bacterium]|nr:c-type cytochrome [bacterium]